MEKKGFTLVELLAVIVILAVIALIAVPQVMKIIEQSRKDAYRQSVIGVTKTFELGIANDKYEKDRQYNIDEIEIENKTVKSGTIIYNSEEKKVVVSEAGNGNTVDSSKYLISGTKEEIANETVPVINPSDSLKNQLIKAVGKESTSLKGYYDEDDGYLKGGNYEGTNATPNYIKIPETNDVNALYRAVKINSDGSVLVVKNEKTAYFNFHPNYTVSNFAKSELKDYLNNTFYPLVANHDYIIKTTWDTKCGKGLGQYMNYTGVEFYTCPDGGPDTIETKIGLLTLFDVLKVGITLVPEISNTYLSLHEHFEDSSWWLGTGLIDSDNPDQKGIAWFVSYNGYISGVLVPSTDIIRPAFTLKPGLTTSGKGTKSNPFIILE